MKKIFKKIKNFKFIPKFVKQQIKINTLKNEVETLKNAIKDDLYKEFINQLNKPEKIEKIKNENKRLKKQIKELKESLKN